MIDNTNSRIVKYRNDCISEYLASGYILFPCSQNKIPLIKGWNKLTATPANFVNGCEAFGVLLRAPDMVLDYDPRRDPIYLSQLKKFLKLLGYQSPIKTLIVKTARNGLHIYLKRNKCNIIPPNYVPHFPAIEVKRQGHYVIGAGSVINGIQYKIIRQ
jgi:hypothetical protein